MYYITILDFANGSVDQYDLLDQEGFDKTDLAHWQTEDFENFLISEGYRLGEVNWMSHADNEIYYF